MKPFDASGAFRPFVDGSEVQQLAIRGAGVTVFSSGLGLAIQILATVVLARLLTPQDFGVVTMVTTFSLLLVNFGLNGFTEAILQRDEMDHGLASNLFWISVGAGSILTVGFAAIGSLLARFYQNPEVAGVAVGMSTTIFLTSLSVQHLALLKRAMRFSATSALDIASRIASMAVSIVLAWAGWGYWALVAGAVAQPLSQSIGAWILCQWMPGLPRRGAGTGSMVEFAMHVYGRFSVNYFARNVDNLLVGWRFGAIPLGFYKKAYDLFALSAGQLTAPLANVAVSALSRFKPDSPEYRRLLLRALSVMAFIGMGLAAALTLIGKDLIRLLLGPRWEPAGQIFSYFGPGVGVMIVYYIHGWIHLSIGRADRWFRWGLIEVAVTCLLFFLALPWGPVGIAVAWTASFWILTIPAFWYAGKPIGLGVGPVLTAVWKYAAASLLAACICVGVLPIIPVIAGLPGASGALVRTVTVSLLFGALYLGTVVALHDGDRPLAQVAGILREMLSSGKGPTPAPSVAAQILPVLPSPSAVASRKPLVSILIPAFNAQEWIADTMHSALAQTWEPKEIIVVDDGSSDRTLAIARQFESDTVRVIAQKNQGAATARNEAFSASHGEYIQWLDADDLLAPDKIARQMELLDKFPSKRTLLSSSFGLFKYRHYRAEFVPTALWCDLSPVEWLVRKLGQNVYMQTATWLVSRELTEAAGPWDVSMLVDDDGEYFCRVLLASDGVRFVPGAKVYYRAPWVDTLSYMGRSGKKLDGHWRSMRLHIQYLRSLEDSQRVRAACLRYLQTSLIYFYPERPDIVKEAEQTARDLGGQVKPPSMGWKYSWIVSLFGWWSLAKNFQVLLPRIRWRIGKTWDQALFRIQKAQPSQRARNREVDIDTNQTTASGVDVDGRPGGGADAGNSAPNTPPKVIQG